MASAVHASTATSRAVTGDVAGLAAIVTGAVHAATATSSGALTRDVPRLPTVVTRAHIRPVAIHHHLVPSVGAFPSHVTGSPAAETVIASVHTATKHAGRPSHAAESTATALPRRPRANTGKVADFSAQVALTVAAGAVPRDVADIAACIAPSLVHAGPATAARTKP